MPQFVGQGLDVTNVSGVIQQHVGVGTGNGWMTEGTSCFAGFYRRIDPPMLEEVSSDGSQAWMERLIGL